jgi:hypothetical protein
MRTCEACGGSIDGRFRFCPWCAAPQRSKLVEFFVGTAATGDEQKALRASRYLREGHVRFSVWNEAGVSEAAMSIDEAEAARLATFLVGARAPRSFADRVRDRLGV